MKLKATPHLSFLQSSAHSVQQKIFFSLVCILASVLLPVALFVTLPPQALLLLPVLVAFFSIASLSRLAKGLRGILGYAILLILILFLLGPSLLVAMLAAYVSAVVLLAVMWAEKPSPLLLLIPIFSFTAVFLYFMDPFKALFALIPSVSALVLGQCLRNSVPRVGSICRLTASLLLPIAGLFLLFVFLRAKQLSPTLLRELFDAFRGKTETLLLSNIQLLESYGMGLTLPDVTENVPYVVSVLFNHLPAIVIILGMLVSFFIHTVTMNVLIALGIKKEDAIPLLTFDMSLASAICFLCALVLGGALQAEGKDFLGTCANNLYLLLIPGMTLTAFGALKMLVSRKGPSCFGALLYMGAILLLFTVPLYTIIVASLCGAAFLILEHVARALKKKDASR